MLAMNLFPEVLDSEQSSCCPALGAIWTESITSSCMSSVSQLSVSYYDIAVLGPGPILLPAGLDSKYIFVFCFLLLIYHFFKEMRNILRLEHIWDIVRAPRKMYGMLVHAHCICTACT